MPITPATAAPFAPIGNQTGVTLLVESTELLIANNDLLTQSADLTNPQALLDGTIPDDNIVAHPVPVGANSFVFFPVWTEAGPPASDPTVAFFGRLQRNLQSPNNPKTVNSAMAEERWWIKLYNETTGAKSFTPSTTGVSDYDVLLNKAGLDIYLGARNRVNVLGCDLIMAVVTTPMGSTPTTAALAGFFVR